MIEDVKKKTNENFSYK